MEHIRFENAPNAGAGIYADMHHTRGRRGQNPGSVSRLGETGLHVVVKLLRAGMSARNDEIDSDRRAIGKPGRIERGADQVDDRVGNVPNVRHQGTLLKNPAFKRDANPDRFTRRRAIYHFCCGSRPFHPQ